MEIDWGLQIVPDQKQDPPRNYSDHGRGEIAAAKRKGRDAAYVHDVGATIRKAWEDSASGEEFIAALNAQRLTLRPGDRRDFIVVDETGTPDSVGKRVTGASTADIAKKLATVKLPPDPN